MGVMRMNLMNLLLHILLVIICIDNISTKKKKSSKILWSLSGLCFSICVILDIMQMI
jgi:Gpi18-like mannosyltransferase